MEKTTIYLTDDLGASLRRHLRRTGARQSTVVREALAAYLAEAEPGLPASIGTADDGGFDAAHDETALDEAWGPTFEPAPSGPADPQTAGADE